MIFKNSITLAVFFLFLYFMFFGFVLFNEEFLISSSLILIFYVIYKMLRKSAFLFFFLDNENIFLTLTYFLKLNINLAYRAFSSLWLMEWLSPPLSSRSSTGLKHVYVKIKVVRGAKKGPSSSSLDKTFTWRENFWLTEGFPFLTNKNIAPPKILSLLKSSYNEVKRNKRAYESSLFLFQLPHILRLSQYANTFSKYVKLQIKVC